MPKMGLTMDTGHILQWLKQEGEPVQKGELLISLETDKAVLEVEAPVSGVVRQLLVPEGAEVPVGTLIALIELPGEVSQPAPAAGSGASAPPPLWVRTSPMVRRLARENRFDLSKLTGSGPGGRIILRDIELLLAAASAAPVTPAETLFAATALPAARAEAAAPAASSTAPAAAPAPPGTAAQPSGRWEPYTPLRRATARQMIRAAQIPQFRVAMTAEVGGLEELRATLNRILVAGGVRLSLTDFLVQACAQALRKHPRANASYEEKSGGGVWLHERVNVGVAVAAYGGGLRVPVIPDADRLGLVELARRRADLVERAREGHVSEAELGGGTFTISNLGSYGVESFDAIVSPPQAAILAVGKVQAQQGLEDSQRVTRLRLHCTLTADHRVLDGAEAAQFLATVIRCLEATDGWRLI